MSPSDRPKPPNMGKAPEGPDPHDPPSENELRAGEALRRALEGSRAPTREGGEREGGERAIDAEAHADVEFAQSIRAAASPREISLERHRQIVDRAIAAGAPRETARGAVVALRAPKSKVAYLAFGSAAGLLAVAAAVALVIRGTALDRSSLAKSSVPRGGPVLVFSRSTADLFPEGIPRSGGTTDRIDRIAYARAQDFRQNQFARWGAP